MNKQAELTRWTPKRLLSLLMALIMTLSLLPTAAFAAEGDTIVLSAAHWEEPNKTKQLSSYTYSDSDSSKPNFGFFWESDSIISLRAPTYTPVQWSKSPSSATSLGH